MNNDFVSGNITGIKKALKKHQQEFSKPVPEHPYDATDSVPLKDCPKHRQFLPQVNAAKGGSVKSEKTEQTKQVKQAVDQIFEEAENSDIPVFVNLSNDEHPLNKQISVCAKLLLEHVNDPDKPQEITFPYGKDSLKIKIVCRRQKKIIKMVSFCVLYNDKEWVEIARTPWAAACYIVAYMRREYGL